MTICVTNCLHWIGYHIVNRLLEEGYEVDGITSMKSKEEEERSLMFGRNSSFTLVKDETELGERNYSELILLGNRKIPSVSAVKTYNFVEELQTSTFINIRLPLLFGEWMPMDERGIYTNKLYVPFNSSKFQNEAIYIDDFIDCFMQWRNVPKMPRYISLSKENKLQNKEETDEKQLYIRENRPTEKRVSNLIEHYEKIKNNNL